MSHLEKALERIKDIESAVANGDLEKANLARIDSLTLGVRALQTTNLGQLRDVQHQRGGAEAYQAMQQSTY